MNATTQPLPNANGRKLHQQLQADAETLLRDLAYVLKLTQRVRDEILSEQEESQTVAV